MKKWNQWDEWNPSMRWLAGRPGPPLLTSEYEWLPSPRVRGPAVQSLERNRRGRDLVISDIHGQRATFERLLEEVGYSKEDGDRLLLLGDVIDRGPDSAGMLDWVLRDGVYCIRGNHENFMLDAFDGYSGMRAQWEQHNGGRWWRMLTASEREKWHETVRAMPFALEVEGGQGTFVLVHAEVPGKLPWKALKELLERGDRASRALSIWGRDRLLKPRKRDRGVPDVWRTFHGHTPRPEPEQIANMRWIDLGAAYPDRYDTAAVACVPIGPDGTEHETVKVRVLDVDPSQAPDPNPEPEWSIGF